MEVAWRDLMNAWRFLSAWGRILQGRPPMLSIEITRECPLRCPGCYAYEDQHLGGGVTLRQLRDLRGDALVDGILRLVREHRPVHLSLVGGEPLVRHRELSRVLPALSAMRVETLVVTSGVIPIPPQWNVLKHIRIAVSVDGLRADHDRRRSPATYERILENIAGRRVDISWVITRAQLERPGYLDDYLEFWSSRPEIGRIWLSLYTPQVGEQSAEMITPTQRRALVPELIGLSERYPALLMSPGIAAALATPPSNPARCVFSRVSVNYSADLKTRVQPCFYGGEPDCRQCGCAVTAGLHWVGNKRVIGPIRLKHVMESSIALGNLMPHIESSRM
jgi:MoaA/NifB/PqqE/SkfB family radical SAM enzyme